jgi:hypothetical protein
MGMLKLPSKRWKKVRVISEGPGRYTLFFLSPLKDEDEMTAVIEYDLEECLAEGDRVVGRHWETRAVTLDIADFESFERKLLFVNMMIEEQ